MKALLTTLMTCLLLACQPTTKKNTPRSATWQLQLESSELSFVSTKNKSISETHTVPFGSGQIESNGSVELILDLNQVESQIPIRNQRMKDLLFETSRFPHAKITSTLVKNINHGSPVDVTFELSLHAITQTLTATVLIQEQGDEMVVTSYMPVQIHAKDFDLDSGINQLTQVAKLKAISYEVPVDFKLVFHKINSTNQ